VKTTALAFCLFVTSLAFAGDTGVYTYRLGDWDFQLSSVGDGRGGIVSSLEARHRKRTLVGTATLDHRWFVLVGQQFEQSPKSIRPLFETLVDFAAPEWRTFDGSDVLAAMREAPPTLAYKRNFEFITKRRP
jgi:hypothetical protein